MKMTIEEEFRPLELGDTRTAFADRTDGELRNAELLFRILGNNTLSALGQRLTLVALKLGLPVKGLIKRTIFRHFCGGETIEESVITAERLARSDIGTILDLSVEGLDDEASLDHTVSEILRTIKAASNRKIVPACVFKPTGICRKDVLEKVSEGQPLTTDEEDQWLRAQARMERLCSAAFDASVPILVDAEESWLQQAIDDLVERMMERFNKREAIVFNTLQFYRHDRFAFLHQSLERAKTGGYHLGIKLVRGAYMEKERERAAEMNYPSPIHPDKESVDKDFNEALRVCIDHIDRTSIVAGTHNEHSTLVLTRLMQEKGLEKKDRRIFFSQLLGMSDHISFNLAAAGYHVVKYVPYGPVEKVIPYLIRRAEENSSVAGQTGRELQLIRQELERRAQERKKVSTAT